MRETTLRLAFTQLLWLWLPVGHTLLTPRKAVMGSTGVTEPFPAQSSRLQSYSSPPPTPHSASSWALEVDLPTTARGRGDERPSETKWFPQSHVGLVRQSPQTTML